MSKLLFDSYPLIIIPELATKIGLNESIVLQQIHYWLEKSNHKINGRYWVYNSVPEWLKQFPFISESTLKRALGTLRNKGIIITANFNKLKMDKTLWYSIDYDVFNQIISDIETTSKPAEIASCQIEPMVMSNWTDESVNLNLPIPEITTETTTEIKNQSVRPDFVESIKKTDRQNSPPTITEKEIKDQIGYKELIIIDSSGLVDEITLNILDMHHSDVCIDGYKKPKSVINSVLNKLTYWHIIELLERYKRLTYSIKNNHGYLRSMIYNIALENVAKNQNDINKMFDSD